MSGSCFTLAFLEVFPCKLCYLTVDFRRLFVLKRAKPAIIVTNVASVNFGNVLVRGIDRAREKSPTTRFFDVETSWQALADHENNNNVRGQRSTRYRKLGAHDLNEICVFSLLLGNGAIMDKKLV